MFANCRSFVLVSLQHLSADTNNKESHACHFRSHHNTEVVFLYSEHKFENGFSDAFKLSSYTLYHDLQNLVLLGDKKTDLAKLLSYYISQ